MFVKTLLADTLSVLLALGSFAFYMAGFFYPEVHRRNDLVWSGLGLVCAALLWFGGGQMTVVVLLAQVVGVALLLGLGWQTLSVRREKTPVYQQTPIVITPEVVTSWTKNQLNQLRIAPKETVPVRLEKRASSQQLDPRRRPAYDYEFVEDGLVENSGIQKTFEQAAVPEAVENSSAVVKPENRLFNNAGLNEAVEEKPLDAPPSVEAKIISVETSEIVAEEIVAESVEAPASVSETSSIEPELTVEPELTARTQSAESTQIAEGRAAESEMSTAPTAEAELVPTTMVAEIAQLSVNAQSVIDRSDIDRSATDSRSANTQSSENIAVEATPDALAESSDEDWDDELFGEVSLSPQRAGEMNQAQPKRDRPPSDPEPATKPSAKPIAKTREKPSILATPVILVGWVKDVVTSLTRPKPAKPVIEIPRREPPEALKQRVKAQPSVQEAKEVRTKEHDRDRAIAREPMQKRPQPAEQSADPAIAQSTNQPVSEPITRITNQPPEPTFAKSDTTKGSNRATSTEISEEAAPEEESNWDD